MIEIFIQPNDKVRVGDLVIEGLKENNWTSFHAIVAFAKRSGVKHIYEPLSEFSKRGKVQICVGVDQDGTTQEALQMLLDAVGNHGDVNIFHNRNNSTFHPKMYVFRNKQQARIIIGSNNLTEGGIYTNYEVATLIDLNLEVQTDQQIIEKIDSAINNWTDTKSGLSIILTDALLLRLVDSNAIPSEIQARKEVRRKAKLNQSITGNSSILNELFAAKPVLKAPKVQILTECLIIW